MLKTHGAIFALTVVLAVAACGDDDPVGPQLADLAGVYTATTFEFTSDADPATSLDVVQSGGDFDATIQESGDFSANLLLPGAPQAVLLTGVIEIVDENTLSVNFDSETETRLAQAGLPFEDFSAEFTLEGDVFTWSVADSSFDFGQDGTVEDANLDVVLVRS